MKYYEVLADDDAFADRWFLDNPLDDRGAEIFGEVFCMAHEYRGAEPVWVPLRVAGRPVAFHLAALDMPVVSDDVAEIVQTTAPGEAEFFPVPVGPERMLGYQIMNVLHAEPCLDPSRSSVMWWKEEDGRPEKTGKPRMVMELKIDVNKTGGRHILRIKDWDVVLLVSEILRERLEQKVSDLGVVFVDVT